MTEPSGERELELIMEKATQASLHSSLTQLGEGYVSYKGIRLGVCGKISERNGQLKGYSSYSSICIRIPAEFSGDGQQILKMLCSPEFKSTVILSPPGGGKTTLLREIIRRLSDSGLRTAVVDERQELCGGDSAGGNFFELGRCCDVLSGVDKARGSIMLLRGMNPQIIAMDEITKPEDTEALLEAAGCGVELLATAHCSSASDLTKRPIYRRLLSEGIFRQAVEISNTAGKRSYRRTEL